MAAHLPGSRGDGEPRGLRKLTRLGDAVTTLACCLDWDVHGRQREPRRDAAGWVQTVAGHGAEDWVGLATGGLLPLFVELPLWEVQDEARITVQCDPGDAGDMPLLG